MRPFLCRSPFAAFFRPEAIRARGRSNERTASARELIAASSAAVASLAAVAATAFASPALAQGGLSRRAALGALCCAAAGAVASVAPPSVGSRPTRVPLTSPIAYDLPADLDPDVMGLEAAGRTMREIVLARTGDAALAEAARVTLQEAVWNRIEASRINDLTMRVAVRTSENAHVVADLAFRLRRAPIGSAVASRSIAAIELSRSAWPRALVASFESTPLDADLAIDGRAAIASRAQASGPPRAALECAEWLRPKPAPF